ncbi:copia protein [Tanacetum coccineum]
MLSSIVDAFVEEHEVGSVGVNRDEGIVGTGTFVTGNSPMQNIFVTPTCRSFKVIDKMRNVTTGPEVATNSLNPVQSWEMKFFLGLQIHQSTRGIFINQSKYALEILKKHGMDKCDSIGTPMATSPKLDADLSGKANWKAPQGGCLDTYKTNSGKIQFLGDKLVSWSSKKHDCTTMPTAEGEC